LLTRPNCAGQKAGERRLTTGAQLAKLPYKDELGGFGCLL